MKIAFKKITTPKSFQLQKEGLHLDGTLSRIDSKIIKLDGHLDGELELICDRSGEKFTKKFSESLVLYISDGIWHMQNQNMLGSFDVIEFFDGFIDLDSILHSEIESIRTDYHIKGE